MKFEKYTNCLILITLGTIVLFWYAVKQETHENQPSVAAITADVQYIQLTTEPSVQKLVLPSELRGKWSRKTGAALVEPLVSRVDTTTTDILHLESLPFLENIKNPCWLERLPGEDPYKGRPHRFHMASHQFFKSSASYKMIHQYRERIREGFSYRMRCLPSFLIIGPQKTGTTDLYDNLVKHPHILAGPIKEIHWWSRSRILKDYRTTLTEYIDLFDSVANNIVKKALDSEEDESATPYITGEATPELIWDNWLWRQQPEHVGRNLTEVDYMTPHYIKAVLPQAKLIAMLRNPVDRLYSDYLYLPHAWRKSTQDFHNRVVKAVHQLNHCFQTSSRKRCMYDPFGAGPYGTLWEPVVRLRMGLYSEFLVDWFSVFPRDQICLVSLTEYSKNRSTVLNQLFDFLGVGPVSPNLERQFLNSRVSNARHYGNMNPETRKLLEDFYKPFNDHLSDMTGRTWF